MKRERKDAGGGTEERGQGRSSGRPVRRPAEGPRCGGPEDSEYLRPLSPGPVRASVAARDRLGGGLRRGLRLGAAAEESQAVRQASGGTMEKAMGKLECRSSCPTVTSTGT
jgi:hypothetical protein